MSPQVLTRMDSSVLFIGASRSEASPAALDFLHPDVVLASHGVCRPERHLLVIDFAQMESLLLLRSAACLGAFLLVSGATHFSAHFVSVVDYALLDLLTLLRGTACLDLVMPVLDMSHPEMLPLLKTPFRPESASPLFGLSCFELLLFALDLASLGLFPPLQGCSHLGMAPTVLDHASTGSFMPLRGHVCPESPVLLSGPCRLGLVSSLPVPDNNYFGLSLLLRTLNRCCKHTLELW